MTLKTHARNNLTVLTTQGNIEYRRYSLIPKCKESRERLLAINGQKSIFPLDSYLGLAGIPFKITPKAMLEIAFWAQNQGSYQRAEEAIEKVMGIKVNDDTVRQVTNMVGMKVFEDDCLKATVAYTALGCAALDFTNDRDGTVYILADGAALNTRIKDKEGSTWRENKLGMVFTSNDLHFWTDKDGERQHRIKKKEYISLVGEAAEFKKHLLACALRGGYGKFKQSVLLGDGATWIRGMAEEIFPDSQQILDFYHLSENVNEYAKHHFRMDASKYKPWVKKTMSALKKSKYKKVLANLETHPERKPTGCQVNLHGYITNNIKNIDYDTFIKKGYFIGSGAIESGNKTILQDRLKRAGMRWNTSTAQAMLSLRTKAESETWFSDVEKPFLLECLNRSRFI